MYNDLEKEGTKIRTRDTLWDFRLFFVVCGAKTVAARRGHYTWNTFWESSNIFATVCAQLKPLEKYIYIS
jgi:hypothetical protein